MRGWNEWHETGMSTEDTSASEHGADAETTQVPPPPRDEPGLAWSADHDTEEVPANWHGRLMWAGLAVLVVAIAAALVLLVSTLFGAHHTNATRPQPIPPLPAPASSTVAAAPAPPPAPPPPTSTSVSATVTVTATLPPTTAALLPTTNGEAAPAHQPLVFTAAEDQAFLDDQRAHGLTIQNPAMVLHTAHDFCRMLVAGESIDQATEQLIAGGLQPAVAPILTSSAMIIYPGCY